MKTVKTPVKSTGVFFCMGMQMQKAAYNNIAKGGGHGSKKAVYAVV
jgi:hypothetical protein